LSIGTVDSHRFVVDPWKIIEDKFEPEGNEVAESIFSLANEYMGTRGNFEEGLPDNTLQGCYIGGIYAKEPQVYIWKRPAFADYSNSIINTTNWLGVRIKVGDEEFSMASSSFADYSRELDMRLGTVTRRLVFTTSGGEKTALCWERFVSHDDKHFGAVRLTLKALNHSKTIRLAFSLDSTLENRDSLDAMVHAEAVCRQANENGQFLLMKIRTTGQYYCHRMLVDAPGIAKADEAFSSVERRIDYSFSFNPEQGVEYVFDKFVSVWTSRDAGYPHGLIPKHTQSLEVDPLKEQEVVSFLLSNSESHIDTARSIGYEAARARHIQRVSEVWDKVDIEISGDPAAQQGARFCMFQLLSTYLGKDSYLNIGPKGYTGENYAGRTFWDSESYCLPFYLFANPSAARNLVEYRYNTLPAARDRAKEYRYDGALYPMTTMDGTEDCSTWEYSLCEIHINSIMAYAVFIYCNVTGDLEYLHSKGIEVLIEIARFWASRAAYVPYRNGYAINIVMGPDEWKHFVNNNFYTNFMAKWVLDYTAEVVSRMRNDAPSELEAVARKIGFDLSEMENWQEVADGLILNYDPELDIFVQDDTFLSLDPYAREQLDAELDLPVERKWTIEKKLKYQIMKQPDVLLAMFLFRDRFTLQEKRSNYRFYEQRSGHGSSLSPCIHSILASEVGRHNQAADYYLWASRLDLDNLGHNSHEGLHISSMAGSWLNVVCGFGGMQYTGGCLAFSPTIPDGWESYSFKVHYRDSTIRIAVDKSVVKFEVLGGEDVPVKMYNDDVVIGRELQCVALPDSFIKRPQLEAVIFDLDGVVTDTAKYHFQAWKSVADEEGIYFDKRINERLKGVSRMDSLNIIMERAARSYREDELDVLAAKKNRVYVDMLDGLTPEDVLPGIIDLLAELRGAGVKTAVCSASRNTDRILERLGIRNQFDVVVTGNDVGASKPDPEGMLLAAARMSVKPEACLVIEDAAAGVEAAVRAQMRCIGIGDKTMLFKADYVLPSTQYLSLKLARFMF